MLLAFLVLDVLFGTHLADLHLIQLFLTDNDTKFSKALGWTNGERTGRYALIIDHGKIVYAEKEPGGDVTVRDLPHGHPLQVSADMFQVSGADAVLSKL